MKRLYNSDDPNASDNGVPWDQMFAAPWVDVPRESLPEWLVARIEYFESTYKAFEGCPNCTYYYYAQIYKGKWNEQTVYFTNNVHSSCQFCDTFTENGERISLIDTDIRTTSKNWAIIFEVGERKTVIYP